MAGRGEQSPSGFGGSMRRLRDAMGWTQKELAEASGLHPNTVAKLERGDQEPNWPVVLKLAAALGVECTAFHAAEGEREEKPATGKVAGRSKDVAGGASKKKPEKKERK